MGRFLKKIKKGFKKFAKNLGEAAAWVTDKVGKVAEGVTAAVAGEKAANKVKKAFNEKIEPATKRFVEGIAKTIALPVNILEQGLIDGVTDTLTEVVQDVNAASVRLIGGKKAEDKFDQWFDTKAERWIEMGTRIVGSAVLSVVPGGAVVLAADAASEVASFGVRMSDGHKATWWDALEVGGAVIGAKTAGKVASATLKTTTTSGKTVGKAASATAKNTADDVLKNSTKTTAITAKNTADDVLKNSTKTTAITAKNTADDVLKNSTKTTAITAKNTADDVLKNSTKTTAITAKNTADDVLKNSTKTTAITAKNTADDVLKNSTKTTAITAKNTADDGIESAVNVTTKEALRNGTKKIATDTVVDSGMELTFGNVVTNIQQGKDFYGINQDFFRPHKNHSEVSQNTHSNIENPHSDKVPQEYYDMMQYEQDLRDQVLRTSSEEVNLSPPAELPKSQDFYRHFNPEPVAPNYYSYQYMPTDLAIPYMPLTRNFIDF